MTRFKMSYLISKKKVSSFIRIPITRYIQMDKTWYTPK